VVTASVERTSTLVAELPNEEAEFAKIVAELMGQPELRRNIGARGRRRVEEELQWNEVGENLLIAYETLLAKA
jgi:glycosyltransferase involved in cell wall biosynthesis